MYQKEQPRKYYNGSQFIPITCQAEIIEIRKEIEAKEFHADRNLRIAYQAYKEIQEAQGKFPMKIDTTCSSCIITINLILNNWLLKFDNEEGPVKMPDSPTALVEDIEVPPIKEVEEVEKKLNQEYLDLLKKFNAVASSQEKATINEGKKPTKAQILTYFKNNLEDVVQ